MLGKPKELLGDRIMTRIVNELAKPLREMARNSGLRTILAYYTTHPELSPGGGV